MKKILLFNLLFLGLALSFAQPVFAAISRDGSTTPLTDEDGGATASVSHTTTTGDFLVADIFGWHCASVERFVSSVTYDGVALTKAIGATFDVGGGCWIYEEQWFLYAPHTGANTLLVTMNGGTAGIYFNIDSLKGVRQYNQPDSTYTNPDTSGASSPKTSTFTTKTDGAWIYDSFSQSGITATGVGTGQTQFSPPGGQSSVKEVTIAGSNSMSYTFTGSGSFQHTMTAFASAPTISRYPNNLGLLSYWSFNEGTSTNATDFSGRGNACTLTNMVNSQWTSGRRGKALSFDNVDDVLTCGTADILPESGIFTISAWIYPVSTGENAAGRIIDKGNNTTARTIFLLQDNAVPLSTAGNLRFFVAGATSMDVSTVDSSLTYNTWHHVVVTFTGDVTSTKNVVFYIDGLLVSKNPASQAGATPGDNSAETIRIGNNNDGSRTFNGRIDEVRVYNRVISPSEVETLYRGGAVSLNMSTNSRVAPSDLVGYWSLDGATVTNEQIIDLSGKGNQAWFIGGATSSPKTIGKIGQAFQFNGRDNYVRIRDTNNTFDVSYITVSYWVKKMGEHSDWAIMVGRQTGTGTSDLFAHCYANGTPEEYCWAVTTAGGQSGVTTVTASTGDLGVWTHIVGTYDGTTVSLYRNGVLDTSAVHAFGGPMISETTSITFGAGFNGAGSDIGISEFSNTIIDEVRIYNRALSAAEVKQLYLLGGSQFNSPTTNRSTSGLIGHWTFNGPDFTVNDVTDVSGNGNRGGFIGGATSTAKVPGKLGQGLRFDGKNDYIDFGNPSSLRPNNISIAGWIKVLGDATGTEGTNSSDLSNSTKTADPWYSWGLSADGVVGDPDYQTYTFRINTSGGKTDLTGSSTTPYLNEWHHVAGTYDGTTMKLYIDGVFSTSSPNRTGNISYTNGDKATIGSWKTNDNFANGIIDEVRIYNRALTATEVNQLYRMGGLIK